MNKKFTILAKLLTIAIVSVLCNNAMAQTHKQLWGMTNQGGVNGVGVIFKTDSVGNNQTVVHSFSASDGSTPDGSLLKATDGKLYGMTQYGGANTSGVLFRFDPITNIYTDIIDFAGTSNGANPDGSLMQATDGNLYGMTEKGGAYDNGILFRFNPVTSVLTKLVDFAGATNGSFPVGDLIQASDGKLYGMTWKGGTSDMGTIFQYNITTPTFIKKFDFDGTSHGDNPYGSLMQASDGNLYGLTYHGGANDYGVLFQYNPTASFFTKKIDFDQGNYGSDPKGSLIETSNNLLYGLTYGGGANSAGVIFQYNISSSVFTNKFDLTTGANAPFGSLMLASDGNLYGMTSEGGTSSKGVLFQFNPTTSVFTKKLDFNGTNGNFPEYTHLIEISVNTSGIAEENAMPCFNIFPNPCLREFTLQLINPDQYGGLSRIEIFNISGKKLYSLANLNSKNMIDISDFPEGMYIVKYISAQGSGIAKIIKQ